jgi:hypothetical protein
MHPCLFKDKNAFYKMHANSKPAWKTPELIVLVRSKPEEAVLTACKQGDGHYDQGPGNGLNGCAWGDPINQSCVAYGQS